MQMVNDLGERCPHVFPPELGVDVLEIVGTRPDVVDRSFRGEVVWSESFWRAASISLRVRFLRLPLGVLVGEYMAVIHSPDGHSQCKLALEQASQRPSVLLSEEVHLLFFALQRKQARLIFKFPSISDFILSSTLR